MESPAKNAPRLERIPGAARYRRGLREAATVLALAAVMLTAAMLLVRTPPPHTAAGSTLYLHAAPSMNAAAPTASSATTWLMTTVGGSTTWPSTYPYAAQTIPATTTFSMTFYVTGTGGSPGVTATLTLGYASTAACTTPTTIATAAGVSVTKALSGTTTTTFSPASSTSLPGGSYLCWTITVSTVSGTPSLNYDATTAATAVNSSQTLILAPAVTLVSPNRGPATGGQFVMIAGSSFTGASAVKFGTTGATAYTVQSDSLISATVPAGTAGTVDITVTTPNGTSPVAAADQYTYTAAAGSDGWGDNTYGSLGDTTVTQRTAPVQACASGQTSNPCSAYLTGMVSLASGFDHTVALKSDGTVWGWGYNIYGGLGDTTTVQRDAPVQVCATGQTTSPCSAYLSGVVSIAASYDSTVAVKSDGTAWTWGYNFNGQLGDATVTERNAPVQVCASGQTTNPCSAFLTGVVAVAAGQGHTVALKGDGTVWAWGDNAGGDLGDATTTGRTTPVQVCASGQTTNPCSAYLSGVVAIAAGNTHTVALESDGTVWAWVTTRMDRWVTPRRYSGRRLFRSVQAARPPTRAARI